MNIRANILMRVYLAFGLIVLLALAVTVQLCRVQLVQGKKWASMADSLSTRYVNVEASRGNIMALDGSLLATSVPEYELHMDLFAPGIASDKDFNLRVDSLAEKMSAYFGDHSAQEYTRMLRNARRDSSKYKLIRRQVTYQQLKAIRKFPVFNLGKYKGGLIVVTKNKRIRPFQSLAARTIGYVNENVSNPVGLEGAYANYINGENGKRLMQRMAGGTWTPVNEDDEVSAKDGADIMSTIDVNFQDLAQKVLKHQLDSVQADWGTVVLMETQTGEVRAIANLTRDPKDNQYYERQNYAIGYEAEPGSTFKLASYMAMLDDHKIDTGKLVDIMHGGPYNIINPRNGKAVLHIKDAEDEGGVVSARRAFEKSSNIGAAKLVTAAYGNNPKAFTDKLYSWHLNEMNGLQIKGEGQPLIKTPKSKSWNNLQSLAQISYGYESKLSPLQMLTFYNSVANNGKMISPIFVKEIRRMGNTIERFHARVLNPQVCSPEALAKVKGLLEGVVLEGTGKTHIKNNLYSVAGKTGTAQIATGSKGYDKSTHQTSFCGYFPADKPKYTMIVVISNPRNGLHLAAWVTGPVFRKIADRVYATDMGIKQPDVQQHFVGNTQPPKIKEGDYKALKQVYTKLGVKPLYASTQQNVVDTSAGVIFEETKYIKGTVPSVAGMGLSDAIYVLGNAGYKVKARGSGIVSTQSVTVGSTMPKGSTINIVLE